MWVEQNAPALIEAASRQDLPPLLLAGVSFQEVGGDPAWIDDVAYFVRSRTGLGKPPIQTSFGEVSMQIRRAAESIGLYPGSLTDERERALIGMLKDREFNIKFAALHLDSIRDQLFPGVAAKDLTLEQMAEVASAYNLGVHVGHDALKGYSYGESFKRHKAEIQAALAAGKASN